MRTQAALVVILCVAFVFAQYGDMPDVSPFLHRIDTTKINAQNCARFQEVNGLIGAVAGKLAQWEAGHNKFSCWSESELHRLTGALTAPPTHIPGKPSGGASVLSAQQLAAIPANFDSHSHWKSCASAIRNQGGCGDCWAYSGLSVMQDRWCIKHRKKVVLSPQLLVSCGNNNGCKGGFLDVFWKYLASNGAVTETCYPYSSATATKGRVPKCATKCAHGGTLKSTKKYKVQPSTSQYGSYLVAPYSPPDYKTNIPLIQQEIMTNGPVQVAIQCPRELYNYHKGIYHCVNCHDILGSHAIKVTGWGHKNGVGYWIIANSWGTSWGMNGYAWIRFGELGIEDSVYAGIPV